ncbi:putative sulfate exporter family transporter, partial [Brooklawnia sp.]|uniref:YeiH family protein n=1 Tax=Brooklawnia sp. TaxID=2699740 RepID=UPI00311D3E5A
REWLPGLMVTALVTLAALLINQINSLHSMMLVAIVLGAVIGNLRPVPASWQPGLEFAARHLLRAGIVLLGLQISLTTLGGLGWRRLALVVVVVSIGVSSTLLIGRLLGVPGPLRMLVACGCSICGAAAVAGAKDISGADEEQTGTALGLVVLFGTLSIPVVPLLAGLMALSTQSAATWAGASIHEVAQVVAAAAAIGPDAMAVAVTVKLARVVCLAPVVAVLGLMTRRSGAAVTQSGKRPTLIPGFVLGFLAMVILGTIIAIPAPVLGVIKIAQSALLAMAMAALGFGIQISALREVGLKPVLLGLIATVIVSGTALTGVLLIS